MAQKLQKAVFEVLGNRCTVYRCTVKLPYFVVIQLFIVAGLSETQLSRYNSLTLILEFYEDNSCNKHCNLIAPK